MQNRKGPRSARESGPLEECKKTNKRVQRVGNPAALRGGFRVMKFRLGSEQQVCGPGDVVVIPGGTEHEAWFREDTEVIDFFAPPREDFLLGGKPAYMSEG
jgi:hypothetical protein